MGLFMCSYPIQLSVDLADNGKGSSFISLLQSTTSNRVTPRHWSPGIAVNTYQVLQINRIYTMTFGPACKILVLIALTSSKGSSEPVHMWSRQSLHFLHTQSM